MSAHHNLSLRSLLKTVLGRLRDPYQAYCIPTKHILWLPAMEDQDNPWIESLTCLEEQQSVVDTDVELQQDFHP